MTEHSALFNDSGVIAIWFFFLYRINFIDITWQTWHMYKLNKHIFKHWKKEIAFWDQTLHFNSVLCLGVFFPWTVCQAVVLPRTANAILQMIYDFHVVSLNTFIWISSYERCRHLSDEIRLKSGLFSKNMKLYDTAKRSSWQTPWLSSMQFIYTVMHLMCSTNVTFNHPLFVSIRHNVTHNWHTLSLLSHCGQRKKWLPFVSNHGQKKKKDCLYR